MLHDARAQIQLAQDIRRIFVYIGNELLIKAAFVGGKRDHFLVIERYSQLFGNELADLLSGRAVLAGNGYDNSGRRGLQHRCGSALRHTESGSFDIVAVKKLPVKHKADDACDGVGHGEGQPEPIKADA